MFAIRYIRLKGLSLKGLPVEFRENALRSGSKYKKSGNLYP